MKRVFIVGGSITPFIGKGNPDFIWKKHPEFGKRENPTLEEYITRSANGALENAGVPAEAIDSMAIGNFCGELFSSQGHLGAALIGANPGFMHKPSMRVEGACASGALAFAHAYKSLLAGEDVTLAVGAEVQTTVSARVGGDYLARASHYSRQRHIDDFTFPAMFARRMKAIAAAGHFTMDDTAHVATKAYANGNLNPLAHMKAAKMTFEQASSSGDTNPCFLGNEEFSPFLRMSDCSQVSDGGAAVVLATEEGVRKLGKSISDCVEVIALGQSTGNLYEDAADMTKMDTSAVAAQKAFAQANLKPSDLHVAEVHDCFTIAEILMYEALGIAKYGEGGRLASSGETGLGGRIPVNTGGGLLSFGHPVGATGIKQILEVVRQMRGECGEYQLKKTPTLGAALNMGGDDKTAVCTILKAA
ncbi:thiolase domain-containing protein [Diplonema papillatum]|nr:acetyl-CoA C-acetyltransferase [Diplonema papillatum]KAJ9465566.1 thiolase domain-containing protein [Diplonema papillatum]|eukprot:gene8586-13277_t